MSASPPHHLSSRFTSIRPVSPAHRAGGCERTWITLSAGHHPAILTAYGDIDAASDAAGRPMGKNDVWIAATARANDATILTTVCARFSGGASRSGQGGRTRFTRGPRFGGGEPPAAAGGCAEPPTACAASPTGRGARPSLTSPKTLLLILGETNKRVGRQRPVSGFRK